MRRRTVLGGLGGLLALWLGFWFVVIPYPWTLRSRNPVRTSLMEQRIQEARDQGAELEIRQNWVSLQEISGSMVRALIVAEDHRFREHQGIDWASLGEEVEWSGDEDFAWWSPSDLSALARAFGYVWTHRSELRGRSTITQQLAKNLYFGTDRSLLRKAAEFVVAGRLERRLGKDRILELYLNVVEWGPGVFGVEAASRHYFDRSAADLTLFQAASLAATLPHPLTSNPARNPGRMAWRRDLILQRLNAGPGAVPAPIPLPDIAGELPVMDPGSPPPAAGAARGDTLPGGSALPDTAAPLTLLPDTLIPDTSGVPLTGLGAQLPAPGDGRPGPPIPGPAPPR